jgi:hypothetical protein
MMQSVRYTKDCLPGCSDRLKDDAVSCSRGTPFNECQNCENFGAINMNALFNSALRQSTSIRKDLDQFADSTSPSPHLQAQLHASLTTFSRTIEDYGKLTNQEPVQTKREKALERLKNFRSELDEYRASFRGIKNANEDVVRAYPCHT